MAKIKADNMDNLLVDQQKASESVTNKTETTTKKPNSDYIRLDLKPTGYPDLKAYVNKRCGFLSQERDKKISSTAFIQELIIKDMKENKGKERKLTKREKIMLKLEQLDDKKLSALATLLDIQIV